jgi:hypothetical protein
MSFAFNQRRWTGSANLDSLLRSVAPVCRRQKKHFIDETIGSLLTWSFLFCCIGLSLFSLVAVIRQFIGTPDPPALDGRRQ